MIIHKNERELCVRLSVWPEKIAKCQLKLPKNDFTTKIKTFVTFTNIAQEWRIFWAKYLLPKALKSCSKSNKSPNLVTLNLFDSRSTDSKRLFQRYSVGNYPNWTLYSARERERPWLGAWKPFRATSLQMPRPKYWCELLLCSIEWATVTFWRSLVRIRSMNL